MVRKRGDCKYRDITRRDEGNSVAHLIDPPDLVIGFEPAMHRLSLVGVAIDAARFVAGAAPAAGAAPGA